MFIVCVRIELVNTVTDKGEFSTPDHAILVREERSEEVILCD